jgi:hypothetical protein
VQSFLVEKSSGEILVDDLEAGTVLSLTQWRRTVHRVEVRAAQ